MCVPFCIWGMNIHTYKVRVCSVSFPKLIGLFHSVFSGKNKLNLLSVERGLGRKKPSNSASSGKRVQIENPQGLFLLPFLWPQSSIGSGMRWAGSSAGISAFSAVFTVTGLFISSRALPPLHFQAISLPFFGEGESFSCCPKCSYRYLSGMGVAAPFSPAPSVWVHSWDLEPQWVTCRWADWAGHCLRIPIQSWSSDVSSCIINGLRHLCCGFIS